MGGAPQGAGAPGGRARASRGEGVSGLSFDVQVYGPREESLPLIFLAATAMGCQSSNCLAVWRVPTRFFSGPTNSSRGRGWAPPVFRMRESPRQFRALPFVETCSGASPPVPSFASGCFLVDGTPKLLVCSQAAELRLRLANVPAPRPGIVFWRQQLPQELQRELLREALEEPRPTRSRGWVTGTSLPLSRATIKPRTDEG